MKREGFPMTPALHAQLYGDLVQVRLLIPVGKLPVSTIWFFGPAVAAEYVAAGVAVYV